MHWFDGPRSIRGLPPRLSTAVLVGAGVIIDAVSMARWVARHDAVLVPGTGPLESTVLIRPWQTPWALFSAAVAGRLFGVRVLLVCVGVSVPQDKTTRWLVRGAMRMATYRSFRNPSSRAAAAELGVDVNTDLVYPDLVWSLPVPRRRPGSWDDGSDERRRVVGLGVMAYTPPAGAPAVEGGDASLVAAWLALATRLVEDGHTVRLFYGDEQDRHIAERIERDASSPFVSCGAVDDLASLMQELLSMDAVIATRFHNVLCALMCCRPTIAVGYGPKHRDLMAAAGYPHLAVDLEDLLSGRLSRLLPELTVDDDAIGAHLARLRQELALELEPQLLTLVRLVVPDARAVDLVGGSRE
jgi:polysaccharide pyruvyl transferase WcaK-like protein